MTTTELDELFEKHNSAYLVFGDVNPKRSKRPDIHAFLLLDELVPGSADIVGAAEHDEIYLGINAAELADVITEKEILELVQCGVRFDSDTDSLCMFV